MGKTKASWAPPSARLLGRGAWDRSPAQRSSPLLARGTRVAQAPGPHQAHSRAGTERGGAVGGGLAMTSFLLSEPIGPPPGPNFRRDGHPAHRATGHKTLLTQRKGVLGLPSFLCGSTCRLPDVESCLPSDPRVILLSPFHRQRAPQATAGR